MRITCFLFIALLATNISYANKNRIDTLAIAFYNCENLFDTLNTPGKRDQEFTPEGKYHYTQDIYKQKLHNIALVLKRMTTTATRQGPALIGLTEIENDLVLNDLIKQQEVRDRNYQYVWFDGPDERGIDVALLYNPRYFKVLHAAPLHVNLKSFSRDSYTRDVLYVAGILQGDTVHVFVNHWPSRIGGEVQTAAKRAAAASVSRHKIDSLLQRNATAKIIVMGDMNDNPTDASITTTLNAQASANVTGKELYDPWAAIYKSNKGTLLYKSRWYLFDQIIVSGGLTHATQGSWQYARAAIFNPTFLNDPRKRVATQPYRSFASSRWIGGYSDHYPVIIYLGNSKK